MYVCMYRFGDVKLMYKKQKVKEVKKDKLLMKFSNELGSLRI